MHFLSTQWLGNVCDKRYKSLRIRGLWSCCVQDLEVFSLRLQHLTLEFPCDEVIRVCLSRYYFSSAFVTYPMPSYSHHNLARSMQVLFRISSGTVWSMQRSRLFCTGVLLLLLEKKSVDDTYKITISATVRSALAVQTKAVHWCSWTCSICQVAEIRL